MSDGLNDLTRNTGMELRDDTPRKTKATELLDALEKLDRCIRCCVVEGTPVEPVWSAWGELPPDAIARLRALVRTEAETEVLRFVCRIREAVQRGYSDALIVLGDQLAQVAQSLPADELARLEAPK